MKSKSKDTKSFTSMWLPGMRARISIARQALNELESYVFNLEAALQAEDKGNDLQPSDPEADWKANSEAYNRAGISKEGEDHV